MKNTIKDFLQILLDRQGSDLHFSADQPVRLRINGKLESICDYMFTPEEAEAEMRSICPENRWKQFSNTHDLDFAYDIPGVARFRANYYMNTRGPGAVFRHIPSSVSTLKELGMPPAITGLCQLHSGLVLITGPTGSGKSTTLAAMIDYINSNYYKHIITIEEPIEFVHQNKRSFIAHREVGVHAKSFHQALSSAIRSDPDIILIGEMRDLETIRTGLACAAMGTLVFATLHTNNAPKTIDRIIDSFPADEQPQIRTMLAESLRGISSQILCKRRNGGRVAAQEILLWTPGLPNCIREGQVNSLMTIIDSHKADGMCSLDSSLRELMLSGVISAEEAYSKATDKKQFQQYISIV